MVEWLIGYMGFGLLVASVSYGLTFGAYLWDTTSFIASAVLWPWTVLSLAIEKYRGNW